MSRVGIDLAALWVPVMPETSQVSKVVNQAARQAGVSFEKATKTMGSGMARNIEQAGHKASAQLREVNRLTQQVAKSKKLDADATGRIRVEEQRLLDLDQKKKVTAGQRLAAEEAVNRSKRAQLLTAAALTTQTNQLTTAQGAYQRAVKLPIGANLAVQAEKAGGDTGSKFVTGFKNALGTGAALIATGGFIASVKNVVTTGLSMETSLNQFQGVTKATGDQMAAVQQRARELGTDASLAGVGVTDAANAMLGLAKGGFDVQQSMDGVRGTLTLATAAQISAAQAAEIQADALHAFQLPATEAGNVADYLANVANASTADISDLATGLGQAGTVANGFGLSLQDTITALGMFANFGIKGSDAGTLMKTSMQALTDQGNPAQGAIEELGLQLYDTAGKFVGYPQMLEQVAEASKHMKEEQFQAATNVLFGSDAMRASMVAANGGTDAFRKLYAAVGDPGGAARMAAANMQGLPGVVESLKNNVEGAKLALYDLMKPALTAGGTTLRDMLSDVTGAIDDLKKGGGGEGLEKIARGWETISGAAKDLAPSAAAAAKALGIGVGATAVAAWQMLGQAMEVLEPPLAFIADILGNNQWLTTGLVATMTLLYAKSKLTGPAMTVGAKATEAWGKAFGGWSTAARTAGDSMAYVNMATGEATRTQTGFATAMRDSYRTASGEAERFRRTQGLAAGAATGMKTAGAGVLSMLGGPWGTAAMGLTVAMGAVAESHQKAAQAAADQKAAEDALQGTLDKNTGGVTEETKGEITKRFTDNGDSARAKSFGLDPNQLLEAATGNDAAYAAIRAKAVESVQQGVASGPKAKADASAVADAGVTPEEMTAALLKEGDGWNIVNEKIAKYNTAQASKNAHYKATLNGLQDLIDVMPDVNESFVTMTQNINKTQNDLGTTSEKQRLFNETLNGTWKATQEGVDRFHALGVEILGVPSGKTIQTTAITDVAKKTLEDLGYTVERLPDGSVKVTATTDDAATRIAELVQQTQAAPIVIPIEPNFDKFRMPDGSPITDGGYRQPGSATVLFPGHGGAAGGRVGNIIRGPGTGTSDSIPAVTNTGHFLRVANGESINTEVSTRKNMPFINAMNKGWTPDPKMLYAMFPGFSGGGAINDAVNEMTGAPYAEGGFSPSGADSSGAMSMLANAAVGRPNDSRMSTRDAEKWLTERGFVMGSGPSGTFRLGWTNGPGGGHMAGTLPDGRNVEMGGAVGDFTAGGSVGAGDSQFTQQAYLPLTAMYPDGLASGAGGSGSTGGSGSWGGRSGSGGAGGAMSAADEKRVRDAEQKVSDKEFAITQAEAKLNTLNAGDQSKVTPEKRAAAERAVTVAEREHQDALTDLTTAQDKAARSTKSAASGPDGKGFGKDLLSGAMEVFGFDGSVFDDPSQWGLTKLAAGLFNWATKPAGTDGASSGGGSGSPLFDMLGGGGGGDLFRAVDTAAAAATAHQGTGAPPGPVGDTYVDASTQFQGNVGMNPPDIVGAMNRNTNAQVRKNWPTGIPTG